MIIIELEVDNYDNYQTQFDRLGNSVVDKSDTKMMYISIIIFPNTVPTPLCNRKCHSRAASSRPSSFYHRHRPKIKNPVWERPASGS